MGAVRGRLYWEDRDPYYKDPFGSSDSASSAVSSSSLPVTEILIAAAVILVILFLLSKCQKATDEQIQTVSAAISKLIVYGIVVIAVVVLPLAILLFGCEYYNYMPKNAKEFICLFGLIANLILWPLIFLFNQADPNKAKEAPPRQTLSAQDYDPAKYPTLPNTIPAVPTRGAMQGVHPIGKLLFTLIGGGILLTVSHFAAAYIFRALDYIPDTTESLLMSAVIFLSLFGLLWRFFSASEKKTQAQLSHHRQYPPRHNTRPPAAPR